MGDLGLAREGADADVGWRGHRERLVGGEQLRGVKHLGEGGEGKREMERGGTFWSQRLPSRGRWRGNPKPSVAQSPSPCSRA